MGDPHVCGLEEITSHQHARKNDKKGSPEDMLS